MIQHDRKHGPTGPDYGTSSGASMSSRWHVVSPSTVVMHCRHRCLAGPVHTVRCGRLIRGMSKRTLRERGQLLRLSRVCHKFKLRFWRQLLGGSIPSARASSPKSAFDLGCKFGCRLARNIARARSSTRKLPHALSQPQHRTQRFQVYSCPDAAGRSQRPRSRIPACLSHACCEHPQRTVAHQCIRLAAIQRQYPMLLLQCSAGSIGPTAAFAVSSAAHRRESARAVSSQARHGLRSRGVYCRQRARIAWTASSPSIHGATLEAVEPVRRHARGREGVLQSRSGLIYGALLRCVDPRKCLLLARASVPAAALLGARERSLESWRELQSCAGHARSDSLCMRQHAPMRNCNCTLYL